MVATQAGQLRREGAVVIAPVIAELLAAEVGALLK
jgi:hypothetical protein